MNLRFTSKIRARPPPPPFGPSPYLLQRGRRCVHCGKMQVSDAMLRVGDQWTGVLSGHIHHGPDAEVLGELRHVLGERQGALRRREGGDGGGGMRSLGILQDSRVDGWRVRRVEG